MSNGMDPFSQGLQGLSRAIAPVSNAAWRIDDALMPFAAGPEGEAGSVVANAGKSLLEHFGPGLNKLIQSSPEFAQHAAQYLNSLKGEIGHTPTSLLTDPSLAKGDNSLGELQKAALDYFKKYEGKPVVQAAQKKAVGNAARAGAVVGGRAAGAKYVADVGTRSDARPKAKPSAKEVAKSRQSKPAAKATTKPKAKAAKKAKKKTKTDKDS